MSFERALAERLVAGTTVGAANVHGGRIPQNATMPCVAYATELDLEPKTMGTGAGDPYAHTARATAWAKQYEDAKALAVEIRATLDDWRVASVHGLEIQGTTLGEETDDYSDTHELHSVEVVATVWVRTL